MERNIAIVVGAALIALAIMVTNHWTINTPSDNLMAAARLNRWTGAIDLCAVDLNSITGGDLGGAKMDCTRK
jgi:hypothetical protein